MLAICNITVTSFYLLYFIHAYFRSIVQISLSCNEGGTCREHDQRLDLHTRGTLYDITLKDAVISSNAAQLRRLFSITSSSNTDCFFMQYRSTTFMESASELMKLEVLNIFLLIY